VRQPAAPPQRRLTHAEVTHHKERAMKPKKKPKNKKPQKHRNNGGGGGGMAPPRPRPRVRAPRRGEAPPWKTIGAAVAGSVGSAIASGLIVNQKVAEPETVSLLMAATGGLGAYLTDGNTRVAFTGVAAAGAGQYALVKLGRLAEKKAQKADEDKARLEAEARARADAAALAAQQAQLPGPASPPPAPRQYAAGRGVVVDLFRDVSSDLELLDEDEVRYSTRDGDVADGADGAENDDTPIEIDLDEAA
jgi:hypothetical protein